MICHKRAKTTDLGFCVWANGEGEAKRRTATVARLGPKAAVMRLYDRPANRKSHAHPVGFGRVEGLKYLFLVTEALARIADVNKNIA